MHRTSFATLELMLLIYPHYVRSFHFLFMRKATPALPLFGLDWNSRWPLCKVVKHSSGLLTSEIHITSHINLVSISSSSSSCMCSSLSRVFDPEILSTPCT